MRTDKPATWFRMYAEFANDPKVQMLSEAEQRRYIMLLCIRCSNGYVTLHDNEVAFQLRVSLDEWVTTKAVLIGKNLISNDNTPNAWDKRQYASDSSAERVSAHRERKKQLCNVTVTPPETETETEKNIKALEISDENFALSDKTSKTDSDNFKIHASKDNCPHEAIISIYHEKLPELTRVAVWNEHRRTLLRSRWREDPARQTTDWWERLFGYVSKSDFLMGRTETPGRKTFAADLEWILKPSNLVKIIEGKYHA
jgi:hypothetical protein